jgi:hypothetical protein
LYAKAEAILVAILCSCLLHGCSLQRSPWQLIHVEGLASSYERISALLFISPAIGFAGADNTENIPVDSMLTKGRARIYKTEDSGRTWKKWDFGRGSVEQILFVDGFLFALVRVHAEESFRNMQSDIWESGDIGKTWTKVYSSKLPYCISKILYENKKHAYGIVKKQEGGTAEVFVSETIDGGTSWNIIAPLDEISNFGQIELYRSGFVFFGGNSIWYYNPAEKTSAILQEDLRSPVMTSDSTGSIWVVAKGDNDMHLLKFDSGGQVHSKVQGKSVVPGYPNSLHIDGDVISIMVSGGHSILGVDHMYYRSSDAGTSWTQEDLPVSLKASPCAYFGEELVWVPGIPGTMQHRNPYGEQ